MSRFILGLVFVLGACALDSGAVPPETVSEPRPVQASDGGAADALDGGGLDATGDGGGDGAVDPPDSGEGDAGPGCTPETRDGHAYLFCTAPRADWNAARRWCMDAGYDLLILDDALEDSWVFGEIVAQESTRVDWWLGLGDQPENGTYRWVDGTVVWRGGMLIAGSYTRFRSGVPEENVAEGCMEISDNVADGAWAEDGCDDAQPFVCETVAR